MDGLMMDFPLTLTHLLRRAETYLGRGEIVSRLPDKTFDRSTYAETLARAKQLAVALHTTLGADPVIDGPVLGQVGLRLPAFDGQVATV